jgi:acyl-CoA reductase-like NAD-dependent aldehyde dehydrogenase
VAVAGGAKTLCGGARHLATCHQTTVLLDPPDVRRISQEEVLGPVISIYTYRDLETGINRVNSLGFAFEAAVLSQNLETAMRGSALGVVGIPYTLHAMQLEKLLAYKSKAL